MAVADLIAPDMIEVRASGGWALELAELIAPDGRAWAATSIRASAPPATRSIRPARPEIAIGVEGGSSSGVNPGIGIGLPLGNLFAAPRLTPIESVALIPIPDPELYRRSWASWEIRLRLGPPGEGRYLALRPPAPAD